MKRVQYGAQPSDISIIDLPDGRALVWLRENKTSEGTGEDTRYYADTYSVTVAKTNDIAERALENFDTWLANAKAKDESEAAASVRAIRDELLKASDARLALDRFGMEIPETVTATTMLAAFRALITGLRAAVSGEWAVYRQALRDLPEQAGFPYNVVWPQMPTD